MDAAPMDIAARLGALMEEMDEMTGEEVRPMPAERIRLIREAALIAREADRTAVANYDATKSLSGEAWDSAFEAGDLAEGHYRSATLILLGLICGSDAAVMQMDAIERRCRAGGF